jgi:prevent-host-death family protein
MTTTMTTVDAKEKFTELLNHVSHTKERVILTRRGKELVAIVSLEDLQFLESVQDKNDLDEAMDAHKESKKTPPTPLETLKDDLGIQS